MSRKQVFKPYNQNQIPLIPMDIDARIPKKHLVRVVNSAIDQMNHSVLFEQYEGGGTSAYHPVMLLKVIVYAYATKIYSCRNIAKQTRENIHFIWLTGDIQLDFMTINRFRTNRLKNIISKVFAKVVELLHEQGYIKLETYFLDGTKIESCASKYSWVWGKNTARYKSRLSGKVKELMEHIDLVNKDEDEFYEGKDLPELGDEKEIDSSAIKEAVAQIDQKLAQMPKNKQLKKVKKFLEKDALPRMEKYEQQELVLKERRSYSKTDPDATFMRMKEDHMKNGQLKPGYNVQIGTENQFVTGYSIHQNPGDTTTLKEHLETTKDMRNGISPKILVADAGYGSEENYEYLINKQIIPYVKYNTFHKEATKKWLEDPSKVQNFFYHEDVDKFYCPMGTRLDFRYAKKAKSKNGYESEIRVYEADNCTDCEHRRKCIKSSKQDATRRIYVNMRLNELKEYVKELLVSKEGQEMRSKRPIEVESVFGNIKGNFGVRRFSLRGLKKVALEWALHCIGHNMRKLAVQL